MTKKILFYCPHIDGHKLEYIHHLYEGAAKDSAREYVIAVPEKFKETSLLYAWSKATNIVLDYLGEESKKIACTTGIKKAWYLNRSLARCVQRNQAENVFLIDIVPYLPFLIFLKTKISGIIYHIYPYSWKKESKARQMLDFVRQWLLAKSRIVEKVLVLNDEFGVSFFNRKFNTRKYAYIADPVPNDGVTDTKFDLRKEYVIADGKIIMLHAGGMMKYKGTLNILKAIGQMEKKNRERYCFVLAGRVHKQIREEFEDIYNQVKDIANIILLEGYLPTERMNALFAQSDYVLIPYEPRSQSSGIIGLAALFGKPVITTGQGVVGRLVARYKLGRLLDNNSPEAIRECLEGINVKESIDGRGYVESHNVTDFQNAVFTYTNNHYDKNEE